MQTEIINPVAECFTCKVWYGSPFYNTGHRGTAIRLSWSPQKRTFALPLYTGNGEKHHRAKGHDVRPVNEVQEGEGKP